MKKENVENIKLDQIALIRHELHSTSIAMRGELERALNEINLLIKDENEIEPEVKQKLKNIFLTTNDALSNSVLLSIIIENIFASFSSNHTLIYNKGKINITKIIVNAQKIFSNLAKEKNIQFQNRNFEFTDIPDIEGDKGQLTRVFINIFHNAVKYSYSCSKHKERIITTEINIEEKYLKISISNYGIGILNDEIEHIFKQGYRGILSSDRHRVGSGFGLYQVQKIIKAHNGSTKITSTPIRKGNPETYLTIISILLPLGKNDVRV